MKQKTVKTHSRDETEHDENVNNATKTLVEENNRIIDLRPFLPVNGGSGGVPVFYTTIIYEPK